MKKICTKCEQPRLVADFHKRPEVRDGLRSWCRFCTNGNKKDRYHRNPALERARSTTWRQENPEKFRLSQEKHLLKRNYDLTLADYEALLRGQGGRCAICRTDSPGGSGRKRKRFHVDHDHGTGKVRGLLCNRCNGGIGFLGDSLERCLAAVEYLSRTQAPDAEQRSL